LTHKPIGREVYDAQHEQGQGDGKVCFDALALRMNETTVDNGNHDAVVRAITGED
jgi:hypothetical protein